MLIGVVALGALLTCLLAWQAAREVWGLCARNRPDMPLEASGTSWMPAIRNSIQYPTPIQDSRTISDGSTCPGEVRNGCAGRPRRSSTPFARPSGR